MAGFGGDDKLLDLDDILDSALDALDDGEEEEVNENENEYRATGGEAPQLFEEKEKDKKAETSAQIGVLPSGKQSESKLRINEERPNRNHAGENRDIAEAINKVVEVSQSSGASDEDMSKDMEETISKTLDMLGALNEEQQSELGENLLNEIAAEFEKMGGMNGTSPGAQGGIGIPGISHSTGSGEGGDGEDAMIDNMVRQLLSKDLMYEPMKQVTDFYPSWLEEHKDTVSKEEYKKYEEQYRLFVQVIKLYDSNPNDFTTLVELMTKLQEYGQPPPEIIQKLMPNGGNDSGALPGFLPGMMGGMMGGDSANSEECTIM